MATEAGTPPGSIPAIDTALNAAKARKATRTGSKPAGDKTTVTKRPRLSDEEKASKQAAKEQERAAKKAQRDADRAAKRAEREAGKSPAHMKKVSAAAAKLTPLSTAAQLLFNEAIANLPSSDLGALANHIAMFNRTKSTERALATKLEVGQQVTIVSGDPRYIGKVGTVHKAQRIRVYVSVDGFKKDAYLFTSDCIPVQPAAKSKVA